MKRRSRKKKPPKGGNMDKQKVMGNEKKSDEKDVLEKSISIRKEDIYKRKGKYTLIQKNGRDMYGYSGYPKMAWTHVIGDWIKRWL